jgi:mono/diheme cytochrome c family protein
MNPRFILASLVAIPAFAQEISKEHADFYINKVLPIFAENCYRCHSAEGGKDKGGLTLDTREAMLKGGETGPAVVPGDAEKSLLIKAVGYKDSDLQMPPKGEKLTDAQVAELTAWVKMGAPVATNNAAVKSKLSGLTDKARAHWAFQPVKKPAVPATNKNQQWCKTPVDAFLLQKIEAAGMQVSLDAPKEAQLRRAYYDMIGLPPTPAEIQAYLGDTSRDAWAKVVERLLASPHYGERWGRHWLDTARYSDTAGSNVDGLDYRFPHAWTYRDWVIQAVQKDMPYDEFIVHQLAADMEPKDKQGYNGEHLAALGFITVGERFGNGNDTINERIDTTSKAFLGLTVACARCHDHMFDPIPQKDYYALHGVFSSITEPGTKPQVGVLPPKDALSAYFKEEADLMKSVRDGYFETLGKINQNFRLKAPLYFEAFTKSRVVPPLPEGSPLGTPRQPSEFTAFLRTAQLDTEIAQIIERRVGQREDAVFGPLARFAEISPEDWAKKTPALLAEIATGTMGKSRKPVNAIVAAAFRGAKPANIKDVWMLYDKVFAAAAPKSGIWLDEMKVSSSGNVPGVDPALHAIMQVPMEVKPGGGMTMASYRSAVDRLPNRFQGALQGALVRYNALLISHPGAPAHAMVVADQPKPKDSPVFIRGQANSRGEVVPRRFLEILSPGGKPEPFKIGSGRLELAQAIASPANPLTARVVVNRVWMHHFGEGFVPTPEDFGTMAEKPTHPELLDWLASYFVEQKWSLKQLHRVILHSRAYIQSSNGIKEYADVDPYNKLLWRANVRRLDFEAVRDSLLVFSGNLDRQLGGKPINLTDEPYSFRRSVYGYVDRGNLPELMAHFDFAKPDMSNSKRTTTVVPQQALFLMNSPMTVDIVRRIMARPELAVAKDNLAKIRALYEIIFQRYPTREEFALALAFIKTESEDTEANNYKFEGRVRGGGGGMGARSSVKNDGLRVSRRPLSAWETFAQSLLLSNESAYVN